MRGRHESKGIKEIFDKNYAIIFLVVFVLFGAYLRIYHIDYPSIGYHNMKENEYIDQVKAFSQDDFPLLHRFRSVSAGLKGPGYFEEYTQMPLLSWTGAFFWSIFGESLAVLRVIIILFSLSAIIAVYLLVKEISKNEYLALLSAFILSILPLTIFFGRNIQPDMPAFACSLFFSYFMFKSMRTFENRHFLVAGIFLGLAGLFKTSFLIAIFPFIFLFPYKRFFIKKDIPTNINKAGLFLIGPAILVFWNIFEQFFLFTQSDQGYNTFFARLGLFDIFTSGYWVNSLPAIQGYVKDNFTWILVYMFVFGMVFFLFKRKLLISKYMLLLLISVIPYSMLLTTFINAHSYYQLPFAHMIAIGIAYFLFNIGIFLKNAIRIKYALYAPLILLLLAIPSLKASTAVQFDTVFFGLDIAGDYLDQAMGKDERFLLVGHAQSVAVCTYSNRRCKLTGNPTVEQLKSLEENRNVSWVFVYDQYGIYLMQQNQEFFDYVSQNYKLAQAGFIGNREKLQIRYLTLKKGGTLDLNLSSEGIIPVKQYELTGFSVPFYVKTLE